MDENATRREPEEPNAPPEEVSTNPYVVLQIPKSADDRAVKKAYFALIRRFPPEKDPVAFQRIRKAYEILADPVARKRYDAADPDFHEFGELGASLRAAQEAIRLGNEKDAEERLLLIVKEQPDLHVARGMLGALYFRTGEFAKALAELETLVAKEPEDPSHVVSLGHALEALERKDAALESFLRARAMREGDLDLALEVVDARLRREDFGTALEEARSLFEAHPTWGPSRLSLWLRRLEGLISLGTPNLLEEADRLVLEVTAQNDPELSRFVSTRVASLAGRLILAGARDSANALLARCERLNPESVAEHPYPVLASVPTEALPQASLEWLSEKAKSKDGDVVRRSRWTLPALAILGAALVVAALVYFYFEEPGRWTAASVMGIAFGIAAAVFLSVFAARLFSIASKSPVGSFIAVHPLYALDVSPIRVKAFSLFHLQNIHLTRHSTNGIYTTTEVDIRFHKKALKLHIRNEESAKTLAEFASHHHRRALELMLGGFLDVIPDADLIPKSLLLTRKQAPPWSRRRVIEIARSQLARRTAVAAAILFGIALFHRPRLAELSLWRSALRQGETEGPARYLAEYPNGRFAEMAKALGARKYEDAAGLLLDLCGLPASERKRAPALPLLEVLAALQATSQTRFPVHIADVADVPEGLADAPALERALAKAGNERRGAELIAGLASALFRAGLGEVVKPEPAAEAKLAQAAAGLVISCRIEPERRASFETGDRGFAYFEGPGGRRLHRLRFEAEARLVVRGAERARFAVPIPPPERVRRRLTPREPAAWAEQAYRQEADRAFEELLKGVLAGLSLPASESVHMAAARARHASKDVTSPYEAGADSSPPSRVVVPPLPTRKTVAR